MLSTFACFLFPPTPSSSFVTRPSNISLVRCNWQSRYIVHKNVNSGSPSVQHIILRVDLDPDSSLIQLRFMIDMNPDTDQLVIWS
uniref:Uncharacterized protein n=1 Tax=Ixodes ricinus TaxID=34613 RepID=A0A6B0UA99_IXORI